MRRFVVCFTLFSALFSQTEIVLAQLAPPAKPPKTIESCRSIPDDALRLRCFEEAASSLAAPTNPALLPNNAKSGWRLVRTPGAKPGGEVVTMMRTADLLHSDPAFAGLALHCGESGPEVLIIVVEPFPPRSRPRIVIGAQAGDGVFEASVLPGGAALLLPAAATALANGPWQSQSELSVKIENGGSTIQGVVPLGGLKEALATINISCSPVKP
jgi:hypothetical protein